MLLNVLSVWRLLALAVLLSCISQAVPIPLSPETTVSADLSDAHVKYKHLKYVVNRDHYLPPPVPQLSSSLGASGGGGDGNFLSSFWSNSPSDQISPSRPSFKNVDEDDLVIHESVRIEYDDEDIEISDDEGMVDEEFDEDLDDLLESFHDSDDDKKLSPPAPIQPDLFKDPSANNDTTSQLQPQPPPQPQDQPQLQDGDIVMVPDCSKPDGNMGPDLDLNPTPTMTPNFPTDSFNLVEVTPAPTATLQQDRPTPTPSDGFLGYFVQPPLDSSSTNNPSSNNPLNNQGFSVPAPTPTPAQIRDNYSQPPSYNAPPRHLGSNDAPIPYPSFGGPNSMQGFFNNNNGGGQVVGGGSAVGGGGGGNINSNNNGNNNNNKGGYFSFKK